MSGLSDAGVDNVRDVMAHAVEDGQVPGVVVALACGDERHVEAAGDASIGGARMSDDTLFRIASLTKPMTAAVVLSLIEDGVLAYDEPVEHWLPELADRQVLRRPDGPLEDTEPAHRPVTVRDLLTFTWGFGMQGAMFEGAPWPIHAATVERSLATLGPPDPEHTPDPDTWLARLGELPLITQPGDRWLYQSGSQVLGVLASRAAQRPFDVVMRERLLDPLHMTDTAFAATDVRRLASAYGVVDGAFTVVDPPDGAWAHPPVFPDGGAGLVSTAADVARFGAMLLGHGDGVLHPATVLDMTRNQLTPGQRRLDWGGFDMLDGTGWGYGVAVLDDGEYRWFGGSGTAWTNVPALDLTVVVLTQRQWDETGPPAVCADVLAAAREAVVPAS